MRKRHAAGVFCTLALAVTMFTPGDCLDLQASPAGIEPTADLQVRHENTMPAQTVGKPAALASLQTPGWARNIDVEGSIAAVAMYDSGLAVIDISIPESPVILGQLTGFNGSAFDVVTTGGMAYVTTLKNGELVIADISNPTAPSVVGSFSNGSEYMYRLAVRGSLAYIANGMVGLTIVDVSTPSAPVLVSSFDLGGSAEGIALAGNYAYVTTGEILNVIDVSTPSAPTLVGSVTMAGASSWGLTVLGNYVYAATGPVLLNVVDVSNPAMPSVVNTLSVTGGGYSWSATTDGVNVYVMDWDFRTVDISQPDSPQLVSTRPTPGQATDAVVVGDYAFVADLDHGIQVFNISSCCIGATGNVNGDPDDVADVADLTSLIDHLFIGFTPLACLEEGNIDGDPNGAVDVADLTALIDHLFITFAPTASCP
ncbi:MAG: hypothetical protein D6800_08370 [Candidatus Zixiibacteriota bacterium]|nr:MAG: hypothetical protein D6800_08370 [candidate division Zixibacteria bacterium]